MPTVLVIVLLLILLGTLPVYPYSSSWGYGHTNILGILLIVLVVYLLLGRGRL